MASAGDVGTKQVFLGCDTNSVASDRKTQNIIKGILEKAGYDVELLPVGPNHVQSAMQQKRNKGRIAIFLVNGADLQTYKDFYQGITRGYYHAKYAYFGMEGWISPSTCSCKGTKSVKLGLAHDAQCGYGYIADIAGMTTHDVMEKYKKAIYYACGSSAEELGNNLVSAMGGKTSDDSSKSNSGSTVKECVQKLLKHWDGNVECYLRGQDLYINKIVEPSEYYSAILQEGVNVFSESVNVTDYNPTTVNHLIVKWSKGTIEYKDEGLIDRFGENLSEVQAVKVVTIEEKVKKKKSDNEESVDSTGEEDTGTTDGEDSSTGDTTTNESESEDTEEEVKTKTKTEPITNYKDAMEFAKLEWNKIKRDNGHTVECQVIGDDTLKVGEWVRVFLPSFNFDGYMYIIRCSNSDEGGDWTCNLSLVDYPPGWGKEEKESDDKSDENESEEETDTSDEETDTSSDEE